MGNFYTDVIQKDPRYNSPHVDIVICDLNLLEPGTRFAVSHMMELAKAAGHELKVAETYRSQARQHALWLKKLTKLSHVGMHGFGLAVDCQLFVNGKYDPDGAHYAFMHAMAVRGYLVSGQGWGTSGAPHTFTDWDHVQRVPIFRQSAIMGGTWYPPADYDPYHDMMLAHIQVIG
jgi:hypothetical protein